MLGGSSSTRSPFRADSWSGTWLGSALGHASWPSVHNCELARSSLSMRRYLSCGPSCKSVSRWLGPRRALPSPSNLLLRTPYFRLAGDLTLCSKCPGNGINRACGTPGLPATAAGHPTTIRLAHDDPSGSIKHYFLTGLSVASQEQLRHLVSPGRLAFCSAPLPDLRAMVRMQKATSYRELQTCLQRTLVADLGPGPAAAAAPTA